MKKIQLLLILVFIYSCNRADFNDADKRNENWAYWIDASGKASWIPITDNSNLENGSYTLFYKNGQIHQKGKLKNGKDVDTVSYYNLKGNLIRYDVLSSDTLNYYVKNGNYISFFQNGTVYEKGIVKNHARGIEWTSYFETGKMKWNRKMIGQNKCVINYYDNGQASDSSCTVNGKNQGRKKFWYKNGQLQEVSDWKDDLQNGIYETFYENGKSKQKATWINGKREGKVEHWYENGQLEFIAFYKNGLLEGTSQDYYQNGKPRNSTTYHLGEKVENSKN